MKRLVLILGVFFLFTTSLMPPLSRHCANMAYAVEEPTALDAKLDKFISLDLRDMDVVDVYKFLALRGGFNVTISKNISGRVTLYLKQVSIRDSLDIISLSNNLGYVVFGQNIIYVMTEEEYMAHYGKRFGDKRRVKIVKLQYIKPAYAQEALRNIKSEIGKVVIDEETGSVVIIDTPDVIVQMESVLSEIDVKFAQRVFTLNYADANDVATKLKESIDSKSVGSTQADTRSNQIIVRALPERMEEVESFIKSLDRKTKAVLIDVKILKLILNPQFDMGIDWSALLKKAHKITLAGSFPISSTITQAGSFGEFVMGEGQENLAVDIKMLKQISSTETLANPSIMVTNNQEAKIHIGDRLAYVTTTTIGTGDSQRVNEEVHYIDVGISLSVIPTINDDGFITMKLAPEISSKTGDLETPQKAQIPLINATTLATEIIVKDGHTIVMGGLRQDHVIDSKKGLPFLMDIPFIGGAFSSISKDKTQTEVAILLTPRIVTGEEEFAEIKRETRQTLKPYKTY
jgi:type II secretory pathway component GspD/PulD (secretin)